MNRSILGITPVFALTLLAAACGPGTELVGEYSGWVEDGRGDLWQAAIGIEATGRDRRHIHLDYVTTFRLRTDGDGAFLSEEGRLYPDGGGELSVDRQVLEGCFYSAMGESYCLWAQAIGEPYSVSGSCGDGSF